MPLISVIVPTRNRPRLLSEALDSILSQTYTNTEVIVINDGGEDIAEVIDSYMARGGIVTSINFDRQQGPAVARNAGIKVARGKYIAYLDDDDVYYPNHLETLIGFLENSDYTVAYSDSYQALQRKEDGRAITISKKLVYGQDFDKERLLIKNYITILNLVHRKDCVDEVGGFDEELETHEDWDLWIRMSQKFDFYHLKIITAEFRRWHGSTTWYGADTCSIKKYADFLGNMKTIHLRYSHYTSNPQIKRAMKIIDTLNQTRIAQKENVSICPISLSSNGVDHIDSLVSVIIPVRNGSYGLKNLLSKIRSQRKVGNIEILLIDLDSKDSSAQIAEEYSAKVINGYQGEFNYGSALNLGIADARGSYIVFISQYAIPINDYWLYKTIRSLIEYPELAVLSSRQFVNKDADLFTLYQNFTMGSSVGCDADSISSFSMDSKRIDWELFDTEVKKRLTLFSCTSSCIRRAVFDRLRFSDLINPAEIDVDFGLQLLKAKKAVGYMSSTGVYYSRERDVDHILKHSYFETKAINILKGDIPYYFDINNITWEGLLSGIIATHNLINLTMVVAEEIRSTPAMAVSEFIKTLTEDIDTSSRGGDVGGSLTPDSLLNEVIHVSPLTPEQSCSFEENCFLPDFLNRFIKFSKYLCTHHNTLEGRKDDFISSIYKVFAMTVGETIASYYLEAMKLNHVTADLKRVDHLLGTTLPN